MKAHPYLTDKTRLVAHFDAALKMSEASPEHDAPPLSSLRLLVSPLQLTAAALWGVVRHRAVGHYGLLEDFITAVLDAVPELLSHSERVQLVLGLRATVVLEMCRSDDLCYRQNIEPHLKRICELINEEETSSSKVKASVGNFSKVVNTLLDDPYERDMFYQKTFPSVFGLNFDSALCALVRKFLMNLEKRLLVPSLDQTSQWLGLCPSVLKECGDILIQSEPLRKLLHLHHKNEYKFSPGHFDDDDIIFSTLSGQPDSDEETDLAAQFNSTYAEEDEKPTVTELTISSVEVTLDENDTDPQDSNTSVGFLYQRQSGSGKTFSCLVCGQGFGSLFEMKRHSISGCSANTRTCGQRKKKEHLLKNSEANSEHNLPSKRGRKAESEPVPALQESWSSDTSEGQMCKRSSRIKTCSVCGEGFTSSTDLTKHMRAHTEDGSQICGQCGEEFDNYENYILHQRNECKTSREHSMDADYREEMHGGQKDIKECAVILRRISEDAASSLKERKMFSCEEGGQHFHKRNFQKHKIKCSQENHQKKRPEMTSHPNSILIKACHVSLSASVNKYNSETDSKSQLNKNSTESHTGSPFKENTLKCTLCDETFSKLVLMRRHYYDSHNIKGAFQCPVCQRVFVRLSDLVNHHQSKLLFQCRTCKRCFISFLKLTNHRENYNDTCATQHTCEICDKSFTDAGHLKQHKNAHKTDETTVCSYCGKTFSNKSSLQIHMNRHTGGFSCPICAKVFFQKTCLQRHMDRHNGQEPYLCEICGKGWATKAYLMLHMVKHSEERPFKCDQCGMTWKRESHLKEHFRSKHTEHRPFKCNICSKAFKVNYLLKQHMRRHTGARPFVCSRCGKSYHKKYQLKNHIEKLCL